MVTFEPADGVEARWKKIYRVLKGMAVGDVLTYDVLDQLFPGIERATLSNALRRAAKEFLENEKRGLRNVRGKGYRVVDPAEHVQIARVHQEKSIRSIKRGHDVVTNVDYNGMSPELRALTEITGRALANQLGYMQRLDVRQKRLEEVMEQTVNRQEAAEEQIEELRRRLEKLEGEEM